MMQVVHANLPGQLTANIKQGWRNYYWKPWKEWLATKKGAGRQVDL